VLLVTGAATPSLDRDGETYSWGAEGWTPWPQDEGMTSFSEALDAMNYGRAVATTSCGVASEPTGYAAALAMTGVP